MAINACSIRNYDLPWNKMILLMCCMKHSLKKIKQKCARNVPVFSTIFWLPSLFNLMGKPKNGRKNWDISCISIKNGMVAKMKVYCITLNVISEERLNYFYTIILKRKIFPTLILTTRLYIYLAICVNDPKVNSIKVAIFSSR